MHDQRCVTLTPIDGQRRRVYASLMAKPGARDNEYWTQRLKKDGHSGLLARVEAGDITIYKATQLAGYRKTGPRSPAAKLSYHWQRATAEERKRFVAAHVLEIDRSLKEFVQERRALKAQKPSK